MTRWQHCISAGMITRWHYSTASVLIVERVTVWVHWIVSVSNYKELWIARRKHQHIQTAGKDRTLIRKTGWGTTERERERD